MVNSTCFPNAIFTVERLFNSSPAMPQIKSLPEKAILSTIIPSYNHHQPCLVRISFSRIRSTLPVVSRVGSGQPQGPEDDPRAVETVLKLYMAMKNNNFNQLSDIIGEECLCICNFVSVFQPFHGKEQVLGFLSSLIKNLGNNIEFVVQPTFHDGMNVGVSWKLEWKKSGVPLGKGFSFYMCHVYQGKVLIKNIEMFLEPILHIEPLRLKAIATLAGAMDGAAKTSLKFMLALLLVAALLLFCRYPS